MLPEVAAGVVLLVGSVACVWAGAVRGSGRLGRLAFAAALACAAMAELTGTASDWPWVAACALATAGIAVLVLDRMAAVSRLSWLDAAMGASSSAALAVSVGADAAAATAAAGVIGGLALSRWRPGGPSCVALVGLAALGAGADSPRWRRLPWPRRRGCAPSPPSRGARVQPRRARRDPRLRHDRAHAADGRAVRRRSTPVAVALATVTVLTGMARAGLTVVERLRESQHQALTDDLTGPRQPPPPRRARCTPRSIARASTATSSRCC